MKIVGVGCGPGFLTEQAIRVIREASLIYGSDRAIRIIQPHIRPGCRVHTIDDFKALPSLPEEAVVLSTGDPMLAGLGYLNGEVIPGISSLQVAAARLRIPLARIIPIVAHGTGHTKGMEQALVELDRGNIVFVIADPKFKCSDLYRRAADLKIPLRIAVCENLGYPDERIITGTIESPPYPSGVLYSLIMGNF
ncbi:MAG: cobalt-precorrin-6Y C(5)-methyltransferase [Methanoregula sp. PtaU1.Bin051]|nr:MAG: cobalt-precorrin-6Y C(5)-methyltransferase [Methanoregula sp. PtaU1.Bin051]